MIMNIGWIYSELHKMYIKYIDDKKFINSGYFPIDENRYHEMCYVFNKLYNYITPIYATRRLNNNFCTRGESSIITMPE